ncbi:MAG: type II secretion system protein [Candidatus Acidoferrales bacterium]
MRKRASQAGFSLVELLIVLAIFAIISGAILGLLNLAQARYRSEQQFLDAFQGARIGVDQLVRDIHSAGYPPVNAYDTVSANPASGWDPNGVPVTMIAVPLVGMVGNNIDQTCRVNGGVNPCTVPNPWELVIETDQEPDGTVDWIYYRLDRPGIAATHPPTGGGPLRTLYRAGSVKTCTGPPWVPMQCVGGNPLANTGVPFVENVTQDPGQAIDPTNNPAVFTYVCPGGTLAVPGTCNPQDVEEVYIVLRVRSTLPDLQTGDPRMIVLQGAARVLNPPQ